MDDFRERLTRILAATRGGAARCSRSPRVRKVALIVAIVLAVYGLLGFFAAPPVIRSQLQTRLTALLGRTVSVGRVRLNPYTLRLQLDGLRVAGRRPADGPFIDIDRTVINASWTSLFRLAPVLDQLSLQHPRINVVRTAPGQFNFSDIIARLTASPPKPGAKPFRFSLSNISVHDGDIAFNDAVKKSAHRVDHFELGIPFLANLRHDTNVFVKPLLAMNVDGSPLRIEGDTKPFASDRESTLHFRFQRLDLPRYLGYVPGPLPVAIPRGTLGGDLTLHFEQAAGAPQVSVSGGLAFSDLALDSAQRQPILALKQGIFQLSDVAPLASRYAFGAVRLEGAQVWYTRTGAARSNFDSLTTPSTPPAKGAKPAPPTDLRIASLALQDGAFHYVGADRHALDLGALNGTITGLSLRPAPAARLDLAAQLDGGTIAAKGTLDLAASKLDAAMTLQKVGLAPLQDVAGLPLAGHTATGQLAATGQLRLGWGTPFDASLAATHATLTNFALRPSAKGGATPVAWKQLDATLDAFDLAKHDAQLGAVTADGLSLDVRRDAAKRIDLLALFDAPGGDKPAKQAAPWRWSLARLALDHSTLAFTDHAAGPKPVDIRITGLKGSIEKLDDRLDASSPVKLAGAIGDGTFDVTGTMKPSPLEADLQVDANRIGVAALEPYVGVPLNVTLARAQATARGRLHYDARGTTPGITYRGDAALENVSIQDKLTGDDFMRWRALRATRIDADLGTGTPRVEIGHLALTAFYARMIINANGRLNVSDVIANPAAQPVSVTRAEPGSAGVPSVPAPAAAGTVAAGPPAAATHAAGSTAPATPAADIHVGGITLAYGQLNFTDDFIKPNYTANLMKLHGTIGGFGTRPGAPPAAITLEAALNDNAPVAINGTLNPLQPDATLDITGKATDVELTRMSTYATQYTGYPITGGLLTANVHYALNQRKLNADNHLVITQLTFGDRDESPGVKHLPVKLAVALLKDSQGNVDINLPVTGSLDDPQFSIGGLVWRAFVGLITKAVTAPFRLLGAAFGGGHDADLDYVAFAPGSAVLDQEAQARLGKIAAMLKQKPDLKLQVTGRVDPAKDVAGLRKVTVDDLIHRAKLIDTEGKHADASPAALAAVEITPDEYGKYLKRAYKDDDFKGKPRDYLGLKLPKPAEMRTLMEASVPTDHKALQALATRRADAVRDWLAAGRLAADRIVVETPKLDASGLDDKGPTTRVQFGIAQH